MIEPNLPANTNGMMIMDIEWSLFYWYWNGNHKTNAANKIAWMFGANDFVRTNINNSPMIAIVEIFDRTLLITIQTILITI